LLPQCNNFPNITCPAHSFIEASLFDLLDLEEQQIGKFLYILHSSHKQVILPPKVGNS
jgi:hypothetical protein